jgi:hypothetical protein
MAALDAGTKEAARMPPLLAHCLKVATNHGIDIDLIASKSWKAHVKKRMWKLAESSWHQRLQLQLSFASSSHHVRHCVSLTTSRLNPSRGGIF